MIRLPSTERRDTIHSPLEDGFCAWIRDMVRLEDLIGKKLTLALKDSEKPIYTVRLHGVEVGGIWVESREMESRLRPVREDTKRNRSKLVQKPVFFIPYGQIVFLIACSTELDESSFEE